jgi:hypothetical protein
VSNIITKTQMVNFIKWFAAADANTIDGDLVDYSSSEQDDNLAEDEIHIWGISDSSPVEMEWKASNIHEIEMLPNKRAPNRAIVHHHDNLAYEVRRLFLEKSMEIRN